MATSLPPLHPLDFEPPQEVNPKGWIQAEKVSFKFAERFLDKARELNDCRRDLKQAWDERDRVIGLVERNLINLIDNCRLALAGGADAGTAPREPGTGADIKLVLETLASVQRTVLHVLEELGFVRVDLLGHTYDDVIVDNMKVEDPFEVLESGPREDATYLRVREVVCDLWLRRQAGTIQVVRRGKINC